MLLSSSPVSSLSWNLLTNKCEFYQAQLTPQAFSVENLERVFLCYAPGKLVVLSSEQRLDRVAEYWTKLPIDIFSLKAKEKFLLFAASFFFCCYLLSFALLYFLMTILRKLIENEDKRLTSILIIAWIMAPIFNGFGKVTIFFQKHALDCFPNSGLSLQWENKDIIQKILKILSSEKGLCLKTFLAKIS